MNLDPRAIQKSDWGLLRMADNIFGVDYSLSLEDCTVNACSVGNRIVNIDVFLGQSPAKEEDRYAPE